jgi:hypothetical protein
MNVGHELLLNMKQLENLAKEAGVPLRFGGFTLNGDNNTHTEILVESLLEAGFSEELKDVGAYEVKRHFSHPDLNRLHTIRIKVPSSKKDALEKLEKQQAELQREIEKVKNEMQEEGLREDS